MKIAPTPSKNNMSFSELEAGDVFHTYKSIGATLGGQFMKLQLEDVISHSYNAVHIGDGVLVAVEPNQHVRRQPHATMLVDGLPSEED